MIHWLTNHALLLLSALLAAAIALAGVQTLRLAWAQAASAESRAELDVARAANVGWQRAAEAAEQERQREIEARQRQAEQAAAAIAQVEREKARVERDYASFSKRWAARPLPCTQALKQMEAACATAIPDY